MYIDHGTREGSYGVLIYRSMNMYMHMRRLKTLGVESVFIRWGQCQGI